MLAIFGNELFLGVLVGVLVLGIALHMMFGIKNVFRYFFGGSKKRATEAKAEAESKTAKPATSKAE